MSEWQPIETAPKDGTYILLWAATWRHPFVGQAMHKPHMALLDVPAPIATTLEVVATHWMPLSEPPEPEYEMELHEEKIDRPTVDFIKRIMRGEYG